MAKLNLEKIQNLHSVGTLTKGNIANFSVFHDRTFIRIYEEQIICIGTLSRKTSYKMAQGGAGVELRWSQDEPRWNHDGSRWNQDGVRWDQDGPKPKP